MRDVSRSLTGQRAAAPSESEQPQAERADSNAEGVA
jgi:hypothetical protein